MGLIGFPNPVNEVSARVVAGGVVAMAVGAMAFHQPALLVLLAYGFVARVLTGPTLSPLGQLATRLVTPRLHAAPRYVPGPPKRFAQGIGAVTSIAAGLGYLVLGWAWPVYALLSLLVVAAGLEAAIAFCLGCKIFAVLMRAGLISEDTCRECANIWERAPSPA